MPKALMKPVAPVPMITAAGASTSSPALLAYADQPDQVETRSPLIQRLAALEREQLQSLVLELVERVPRLVDLVETALTLLERADLATF